MKIKKITGDKKKKLFLESAWVILCVFITLVITFFVFGLWNRDFTVPVSFQNDGLGAVATVKGLIEGNGIWNRPYWSAPFGESCYMVDYLLPLAVVKFITFFTHDAAVVINIFWLLTYVFTSIAVFSLLRRFKVSHPVSVLGAVIYNFLPYHYFRIEHFWLCGLYIIPLALWIICDVYHLFPEGEQRKIDRNISFIFCLLLGLNGIYYAVFTVIILCAAGLLECIDHKKIIYFMKAIMYTVIVFLPIVIFYVVPSMMGEINQIGSVSDSRTIDQIDVFGLRIFSLFLPVPGHRIKGLSEFTEKYFELLNLNNEAFTASLGLFMSVGLIISILAVFCRSLFRNIKNTEIIKFGYLNIIILLIATVGGIADYIGIFLTSSIRCYNRMSVFIACISVVVICILLDDFFIKLKLKYSIVILATFGIMLLSILDQTSPEFKKYSFFNPDKNEYTLSYDKKEREYHQLRKYYDVIEDNVGSGAIIYQMPQMISNGNVKNPLGGIKPYVCSENLKFTYSEWIPGYNSWKEKIEKNDTKQFLSILSVMGISGIVIEKDSYGDKDEFNQVNSKIKSFCNMEPIIDSSERLYFYNLNSYKEKILAKYNSEELELLRKAIKYDIEQTSIINIDLNKLLTSNGMNIEEDNYLKKGVLQYGPYIDLDAGQYKVTIYGDNLSENNVKLTSGFGENIIKTDNLDIKDSMVSYEFILKKGEKNIEFIMQSEAESKIYACFVEKNMGYGFHNIEEMAECLNKYYEEFPEMKHNKIDIDKLYVKGKAANIKEGKLVLKHEDMQYGPYAALGIGTYEIKIIGEGLESAEVFVHKNSGEDRIEISHVKKTDTEIKYQFKLNSQADDIEFLLRNTDSNNIEISSYTYEELETDILIETVNHVKSITKQR